MGGGEGVGVGTACLVLGQEGVADARQEHHADEERNQAPRLHFNVDRE